MKKLLILICAAAVFVSCEDLATRNNLSEEPNEALTVELLDRSKTVSSPTYEAVEYINMKLSDNAWLEYFYIKAELLTPQDYLSYITLDYSIGTDGAYTITGSYANRFIPQGDYSVEYLTGDGVGDDEARTYYFNLNVDGTGTAPLSVREPYDYAADTPFICDKESSFSIAVSDDGSIIYVKSSDITSCGQVFLSLFYGSDVDYGIGLGSSVFESGKWTAVPVTYFDNAATAAAVTADSLRTDSSWTYYAYASTKTSPEWGTLWRSETSIVAIIETAPDSADIISLPASRSINDENFIITPLCEEFISSGR